MALSLGQLTHPWPVHVDVVHVLLGLRFQRNPLQVALLAPAVGFACTVMPIFWLSRLGLPVLAFAQPLAIGLLTLALFGTVRYRMFVPWRGLAVFMLPVVLAMLVIGAPMVGTRPASRNWSRRS